MAQALSGEFLFKVVAGQTRDKKGLGDNSPDWQHDEFGMVRHCTSSLPGAAGLRHILKSTPHHLLLLNGFFDREFTLPALVMRRAGVVPHCPAILSPRGEFSPGALSVKSRRKRLFIQFVNRFDLLRNVWLHATAPHERRDIAMSGLKCRGIAEAPGNRQLQPPPSLTETGSFEKAGAGLRIVFVGKITPMKNLHFALTVLNHVRCSVEFDVYGPIGDLGYWKSCKRIIAKLPGNISVRHRGVIANDQVTDMIASCDLLFLPTLGENFGHAIHEALASGVPVLISDRTPWRELEANGAGWDLPLGDPSSFAEKITMFAALNKAERRRLKAGARRLAEKKHEQDDAAAQTKAMLLRIMAADR